MVKPSTAAEGRAVGEPAAEEIADRQRGQHGRDQRGPGVDAAAEIRVEIARAQHLEAHDDRAGHEGDDVDRDGGRAAELTRSARSRPVCPARHDPLSGLPRSGGRHPRGFRKKPQALALAEVSRALRNGPLRPSIAVAIGLYLAGRSTDRHPCPCVSPSLPLATAVCLSPLLVSPPERAGAARPGLAPGCAAVLRPGGQARRAGGGQCLCRQDRRRTAIRCSRTRSSAASSACRKASSASRCSARSAPASSSMPSGLIVTNNHVIEGADEVKISLADKREFEAEIVLKDPRTDLAVLQIKTASERFPGDRIRQFRRIAGRRRGARDRQSVRRRADGDARHRLGARAHAGRHHRLSVLHPDRCRDQSGQFRRRAGRYDRPAGRHQHRDLLALGRLAGHRLCDPGQHGARGGRLGQERRHRGQAAVARRQAAGGDARDRRRPRPQAAGRRAGRERQPRQPGGARGHQDAAI